MTVGPLGAVNVVSGMSPTSTLTKGAAAKNNGVGFGKFLSQAVNGTNQALQTANQLTAAYAAGSNVPIDKVMIAEQQASLAVDLTVQVRNRVVSAYKSVMNMQV
ncbi:flagellar hook-basal body complex protein FliE [Alicyclobacillus sp. SO9]|uniref:flagellar hook-basal body complex protein FliE n=1 Tax=Alicyclobacillus sp. SO9 TaxID=2665646 RepID=UPI0018E7D8D9|nr:flagellar hook-basal body complex protein FliE [Alicyclobacillus sp. SO9]QQE80802.1 flagellar hook-basal body complex protein FliE [Alicyclobacillus sp. SO9]